MFKVSSFWISFYPFDLSGLPMLTLLLTIDHGFVVLRSLL